MLDGMEYFACACSSPNHTLRFVLDMDEDHGDYPRMPTIYTEIMMSHFRPWYSRIWIATKYIFGMDTPDHYGCWEIDIHNSDDPQRLIDMVTKLKIAQAEIDLHKVTTAKNGKRVRANWIPDKDIIAPEFDITTESFDPTEINIDKDKDLNGLSDEKIEEVAKILRNYK